jgi:hypothetical protein
MINFLIRRALIDANGDRVLQKLNILKHFSEVIQGGHKHYSMIVSN